jgi:hypothetical protein
MTCSRLIGPHEGEELTLMLSGAKPLSLFYFESADQGPREFPEEAFDEQVSLGRFVKRTSQKTVSSPKGIPVDITTVLYSLSDQVWRIDAYLFIAELYSSVGPGYRPDVERLIGNLLGYTAEATEAFINHVRTNGAYMAYG